jgi:inosine-uridine nucleoside N-ribohydrolase
LKKKYDCHETNKEKILKNESNEATNFIIDSVNKHKNEVTIIILGGMTNIGKGKIILA